MLVIQALLPYDAQDVVLVGRAMRELVVKFKKERPAQIPHKKSYGLLSINDTVPFSDFELVHEILLNHPDVNQAIYSVSGEVPILLAYLAVEGLDLGEFKEIGWVEALSYMVNDAGIKLHMADKLSAQLAEIEPIAEHGKKFIAKQRTRRPGPVAAKIAAYLKVHPLAKPAEVWDALKKKPPTGLEFRENRLGRYIEKGAETVMAWPRFQNLVSEHRHRKPK